MREGSRDERRRAAPGVVRARPRGQDPGQLPEGARGGKGRISKDEALSGLRRLQRYIGYAMLLSAAAGIYLLATDGSLWILGGLARDRPGDNRGPGRLLGVMNLTGSKRVYLASLAAACPGDSPPAGRHHHRPAIQHDDGLFRIIPLRPGRVRRPALARRRRSSSSASSGRANVQFLASRRRVAKELNYSRRSFVTTIAGFGVLIGLGVALGVGQDPDLSSSSPVSSPTIAGAFDRHHQHEQHAGGLPGLLRVSVRISERPLQTERRLAGGLQPALHARLLRGHLRAVLRTNSIAPATAQCSTLRAGSSAGPLAAPCPRSR